MCSHLNLSEAEQTLHLHVVSMAENFMSLVKVSEWLNVEVTIAGLVVGHRLAWPLKMWKWSSFLGELATLNCHG